MSLQQYRKRENKKRKRILRKKSERDVTGIICSGIYAIFAIIFKTDKITFYNNKCFFLLIFQDVLVPQSIQNQPSSLFGRSVTIAV